METFFLICFLFGALFTVVSVALGFVAHLSDGSLGHLGHDGSGAHPAALGDGGHLPLGLDPPDALAHAPPPGEATAGGHARLPLLNVSSALAFLTWFGAAGYLLTEFAAWPALAALGAAVAAGGTGGTIVALFLGQVLAGERAMHQRDYRLEGTLARVTVSISAQGVGEILFTLAGARRSEAARSLSGRAIPRETEVVIIAYERGVATVQPWEEFVGRTPRESPQQGSPPPGDRGEGERIP
ncbi:MAG: hypothetical protein HY689_04060 [Chloroflexi bacterium]|nr:hypothetical protein [Chloroflexota bacterium]